MFAVVTKINWLPRHSFYLCIPVIILIPSAFLHNYQRHEKLGIVPQFAKLATIYLVMMNIYSNFQYYSNRAYAKDDYRSAVRYLLQHRDKIYKNLYCCLDSLSYSIIMEIHRLYMHQNMFSKTVNGKNLAEKVSTMTKNADTVFVIINREFNWKMKDVFQREMSDLYNLEDEVDWPYIKIYRFTRKK
ncbi:hypothetical protein [Nostoc sp. 'Peltigera malacea cyanobiont' DB3992]|uniref:hypothetical protein n=1 Tax=Nostoc sp. 'Peltigera malacea cyanobiont' DB3992 TaxID=1206980 RepID=UPI000C03EA4B|nr:hypothetical protein [Nostoc sp. 'Peltigera malacea cyanobiont' DB3992]PHM06676.1 hypothetical protein CK516_31985 [Nostoc sp. 'Peltigera malacea cyanobiont' DB3992]